LIKGHTRFVGRGLIALEAIEKLSNSLEGYEIIVYSADPQATRKVRKLQRKTKLNIRSFKRGELPHRELLSFFKSSRIYLGISLSDGISVSLQEAMVHGVFPIQTDTSCIDEWITDGKSGFIVKKTDLQQLDSLLKRALEDDALVDSAADINYSVASKRLDREVVLKLSVDFYEKALPKI
jgi:glycosyltransferase involved in cell wall biosynthesis